MVDIIKKINYNINENSINNILEKYTDDIMSKKRKALIKRFLIEKVKLMSEQFNL